MNKRLKGLSLFSNVGVAEAYLKEIGIDILIANEIEIKRAEFYKHLYPETNVIIGDITNDELRDKIVNMAKNKEVDFIIATPPCQGMSLAGSLDPLDERNQLIYFAVDVIKRVKPKYVLLENVPQQLKTKIKHNDDLILIPDYIKLELGDMYNFNNNPIIRAMEYSVPQMRKRSIFLMSRKDQNYTWEFPAKHNKVVTLRDAIGDLPSVYPLLREGYEETIKMFPDFEEKRIEAEKISKWHRPPIHSKRHVEWMLRTPSGCTAFDNKEFFPKKENGVRINGHYNTYRRQEWDKPARTITQNSGVISSLACVHPGRKLTKTDDEMERRYSDPRCYTIYELLIIMSLPVNWNIPEWANERMIRSVIGEGIPPLLIKVICENLIRSI